MRLLQSILLSSIVSAVLAADILSSTGFINCDPNPEIQLNYASITFDRDSGIVYFNISGTSTSVQTVSAELTVTAYGELAYSKTFDPCDQQIEQLCPVPAGTFTANGEQVIPSSYLDKIPPITFTVPDLDGQATLKLNGANQELGCVETGISNGKTVNVPAVTYVAAGIALAALAVSGLTSLSSAGLVGAPAPIVTFGTVIGWFQNIQMNGMLSVNYPPVYRAFSKNFAFSSGLIPWYQMQVAIDNFRASTGGNLTDDNVQFLQNSTLTFSDGSDSSSASLSFVRRGLKSLFVRDLTTSMSSDISNSFSNKNINHTVYGIGAYVEGNHIPQENAFMTILLMFAIVLAAITVAILLFKAILEAWALAPFGSFPKRLASFRKRYWLTLAKTITNLVFLYYGTWTLWCIFQFTDGDSLGPKILAAVTLALFTGILAFFAIKIVIIARKLKRKEGDSSSLYQHKETWIKYSLFYSSYKQGCWWAFIPAIFYSFVKNCVVAATNSQGNGQGLGQTLTLLVIEFLMLILFLWIRPFATKASQVINIFIQVIQVLSLVFTLLFVDKVGTTSETKLIAGIVLIAVQGGLTVILAILTAVNALITMCRKNPHRKKRKEAEALSRGLDNLTSLDVTIEPLNLKDIESPLSSYTEKSNAYTPISNTGKANISSTQQFAPSVSIMEVSQTDRPYTPSIRSNTGDRRESRQPTSSITAIQHQSADANAIANDGNRQSLLPQHNYPSMNQ